LTRIRVSRRIETPQPSVWSALSDLESHATWMRDAESIEFITEQRSGVGTGMRVKTVVGPLRTIDIMEVTGWVEGQSITVVHRGVVTGEGTLSARSDGTFTLVSWDEELRFPWWLGGAITAWLARPVLSAIWRGNLRRLEESLSSP
jgi:uncharacterized protein YndB with AHSA1/START domain